MVAQPLFPELPKSGDNKPTTPASSKTPTYQKQYEVYAASGETPSAPPPPSKEKKKKPTVVKTTTPKSYLTPYAWNQVKSAAWNLFKYTGMYVAPPVLGRIAYLYATEQPQGSVARTAADVFVNFPFGKLSETEKQGLKKTVESYKQAGTSAVKLFTEAIPDYLRGRGPGQEYGRMLEDEPVLQMEEITPMEARDKKQFNDVIMADYERNKSISRKPPPMRGVGKKRRASRKMSLNMPPRDYELIESTVPDYAAQTAGEMASQIILKGLEYMTPMMDTESSAKEMARRMSMTPSLESPVVSNRGSIANSLSSLRSSQSDLSLTDLFAKSNLNKASRKASQDLVQVPKKVKRSSSMSSLGKKMKRT